MTMNRQVRLASRPVGIPQAENFAMAEAPIPAIGDNQFLVRNRFLSVDPAMRGWLADTGNYKIAAEGSAAGNIDTGTVMRSLAAGEVLESRNPEIKTGDLLTGWFGWQEYAVARPADLVQKITAIDLPMSLSLGILGLNGVTAYIALTRLGGLAPGKTVLVSTASGSVGSAAGQIAKLHGCRTVGIVGGPIKAALCMDEFAYDAAVDYKAGNLDAKLREVLPTGVDTYFDNTAGEISDTARMNMAIGGRIIVCGTAAVSSWNPTPLGPRIERIALTRRLTISGFIVFDHVKDWNPAVERLTQWVRDGKLRYREEFLTGIDAAPDSIAGLYRGDNLGKRLIQLY
jgi:NADPH-dependent curcumin reductase